MAISLKKQSLINRRNEMDEKLLKALYEQYSDQVFLYLKKLTGSDETAFDLMQDTFIRADRYYKKVDNVKGWLLAIARNLVIDHGKKEERFGEVEYMDQLYGGSQREQNGMENSIDWKIMEGSMLAVLAKQNGVYPELYILRVYNQLSHKEIAALTKISFRTIRRHFEAIRTVLYTNFKEELQVMLDHGKGGPSDG